MFLQRNLKSLSLLLVIVASLCAVRPASATTPHCTPATSTAGYLHPGVLITCDELYRLHRRATDSTDHYYAGWVNVVNDMKTQTWNGAGLFGGTSYTPHPVKLLICGATYTAGGAVPTTDCENENNDAIAAYTQALQWFMYGNTVYATNAVNIMDSWSNTMKDSAGGGCNAYNMTTTDLGTYGPAAAGTTAAHGDNEMTAGHVGQSAPLYAAWAAELFTRAAEIIRYTYYDSAHGTPWPNQGRFMAMLNTCFKPHLKDNWALRAYVASNANWELSAADAMIGIGVFTDDADPSDPDTVRAFQWGLNSWKGRVPSYIHTGSNSTPPAYPAVNVTIGGTLWKIDTPHEQFCTWLNYNPFQGSTGAADYCPSNIGTTTLTTFGNGQVQETCRDYNHVAMGMASLINAAETVRIQQARYNQIYTTSPSLYADYQTPITAALEYLSSNMTYYDANSSYPSGYCTNHNANSGYSLKPPAYYGGYEIAYNAYMNRSSCEYTTNPSLPATLVMLGTERTNDVDSGTAGPGVDVDRMMAWERATHTNFFGSGLPKAHGASCVDQVSTTNEPDITSWVAY